MDLSLLIVAILNLSTMIYTSTSSIRICHFRYCDGNECFDSHCYADIVCGNGTTINIIEVQYGTYLNLPNTYYCDLACYGYVAYDITYTYQIGELCNRQKLCFLSQWKTATYIFWKLDITYECKVTPKTTPTFQSSTGTIIYHSETTTDSVTTSTCSTDALTTPMTTSGNASSNTTETKISNSSSSERFSVTTVASALAAVIVVLVIVVISIVIIKRRKANKEKTGSKHVQCNGHQNTTLAVCNSVYVETNTANQRAEPREHSGKDYEYATALIAINPTNENEYNTLDETAKPIKVDPNYDHIPKQSTSVNKTLTTTNAEIYNILHENENRKGLNDDPNYDHVSKQSPPVDQTYSHIKGGQSDHDQSKYQVHDTDVYSHLKQ